MLRKIFESISLIFFFSAWPKKVRRKIKINMSVVMHKSQDLWPSYTPCHLVEDNISAIIKDRTDLALSVLSLKYGQMLINQYSSLRGREKLDKALANGRGAILFTGHMGPYYLIPAILAAEGYGIVTVDNFDSWLSARLARQIRRANQKGANLRIENLHAYDSSILHKLMHRLEDNKVVFMMGDYYDKENVCSTYVRFLGNDIKPAKGIAWLSSKTAVPVLPVFFDWKHNKTSSLEIHDDINIANEPEIRKICQRIYTLLEDVITGNPASWTRWMDYHLMVAPHERKTKYLIKF